VSPPVPVCYIRVRPADLLGNPMGLVTGMAEGVLDFFYEPGSALFNNPADFGKGMAKGAQSLFKGTVGGSMNTVGKMTGAVGKGLTSLTMDDNYMTERRAELKAEDAYDGVVKGFEHLGSGVFRGVTGIVMNPYKESKKVREAPCVSP
jgi:vacuolar protein sorting-associated protein 13A/C